MKFAIKVIAAMFFLSVFSFCAWYEGSEILDNHWEWKHSTPFSEMLDIEVEDSKDISNLDYFVYAAKFKPMFPALMMMTLLYLITLVGLRLCEGSQKKITFFLTGVGVLLLFLSGLVWSSPTIGGDFFQGICLVSGVVFILVGALYVKIPMRFKRIA